MSSSDDDRAALRLDPTFLVVVLTDLRSEWIPRVISTPEYAVRTFLDPASSLTNNKGSD